jgi:hypothetical protein
MNHSRPRIIIWLVVASVVSFLGGIYFNWALHQCDTESHQRHEPRSHAFTVLEVFKKRKQLSESVISIVGHIYRGNDESVWLVADFEATSATRSSIRIPDWPFQASLNSWSRKLTIKGRYGYLGETMDYGLLCTVIQIDFNSSM